MGEDTILASSGRCLLRHLHIFGLYRVVNVSTKFSAAFRVATVPAFVKFSQGGVLTWRIAILL